MFTRKFIILLIFTATPIVRVESLDKVQEKIELVELVCEWISRNVTFPKTPETEIFFGAVFLCDGGILNIRVQNAEIKSVTLPDEIDFELNASEIEALQLFCSTILYMPKGFMNVLQNLKILELRFVKLLQLEQSDMEQFGSSLEVLILSYNSITHLAKDLFVHNINLEYVDLRENPLQIIEPEFFVHFNMIAKLSVVRFNNAGCLDQAVISLDHEELVNFKWNTSECTDKKEEIPVEETVENKLSEIKNETQQSYDTGVSLEVKMNTSIQDITEHSNSVNKVLENDIKNKTDTLQAVIDETSAKNEKENEKYVYVAAAGTLSVVSLGFTAFMNLKEMLHCDRIMGCMCRRKEPREILVEKGRKATNDELIVESLKLLLVQIRDIRLNMSANGYVAQQEEKIEKIKI